MYLSTIFDNTLVKHSSQALARNAGGQPNDFSAAAITRIRFVGSPWFKHLAYPLILLRSGWLSPLHFLRRLFTAPTLQRQEAATAANTEIWLDSHRWLHRQVLLVTQQLRLGGPGRLL